MGRLLPRVIPLGVVVAALAGLAGSTGIASHLQPRHLSTIAFGGAFFGRPSAVAINHATDILYAVEADPPGGNPSRIHAVDLATSSVLLTVNHPASSSFANHIAVEQGRNRLFVSGTRRVLRYDAATLTLNAIVILSNDGPHGLVIDEVHGRLFVVEGLYHGDQSVAAYDLATLAFIGRVSVAGYSSKLAVSTAHSRLFVAHDRGDQVTVIDVNTLTVLGTVAMGASPCPDSFPGCGAGLAYDATTDRLYSSHLGGITVIRGADSSVVATFPAGPDFPLAINAYVGSSLDVDSTRGLLYVRDAYSVHILDAATGARLGSVHLDRLDRGVAAYPAGDRLYATAGPRDIPVIGDRAANAAPVADLGPDLVEPATSPGGLNSCPSPIRLDGGASYDPDGDVIHFTWRQTAGPPVALRAVSSLSPELSPVSDRAEFAPNSLFSSPDDPDVTLEFELVVDDGLLPSAPDTLTVTVQNVCPFAVHGGPYTGIEGQPVQLDGSQSADPQGLALSYAWNFGDGGTSTEVSPQHTYVTPSAYPVRLELANAYFVTSVLTTADIRPTPPIVTAAPDTSIGVGEPVNVSGVWNRAAGPREPDHFWEWDLTGDGIPDENGVTPYGTPVTRTVSFPATGVYTLTFTVRRASFGEPFGDPVSASVVITVGALPTNLAQCKDDGWQAFGAFKNQGDCVSFVATEGKNEGRP